MNLDIFQDRARVLQLIRTWFISHDFLEVETPILVRCPEMEPYLNRFETEFVAEDGQFRERLFMRTSPEIEMKKLLARGMPRIFQITKTFRNGEVSPGGGGRHNPEFSMLEWYRSDADYRDVLQDTEMLIRSVARQLPGVASVFIDAPEPWDVLTVREAFLRYANVDLDQYRDTEHFQQLAIGRGYALPNEATWDDAFFIIFLNEIESQLGQERPVFLVDYPATQAALAKKKPDDPFYAERFELYIKGVELCNAFSEINDPEEQRRRFQEDQVLRRQLGKEVYSIDESFLTMLADMPRSSGNALGVDRLVMILLGRKSIDEVLLFPWNVVC